MLCNYLLLLSTMSINILASLSIRLAGILEALKEFCCFPEPHCLRMRIRKFNLPFRIQLPNVPILENVSRILQPGLRVLKSTTNPQNQSLSHGPLLTLYKKNFFNLTASYVESQFPNQKSNPYPLLWKHRVLTTEPPGKSLLINFNSQTRVGRATILQTIDQRACGNVQDFSVGMKGNCNFSQAQKPCFL